MGDQELQTHILTLLREDRERGAELLLETYTPLLWSVCRRRLTDPEDIKECINDVFSSFCMNVEAFDPEQSSLKNYLALLADRRAISCFRNNQRRNQAETEAALAAHPDQTELHHNLEEALSLLQPEDAQIIRMKYYGGMTYREIAQQMGLTEEAVKKRGRRSLQKLAKWMLIGLVIAALLAGCTYVAHQYFRYFRGMGVVSDESFPVYQMVEMPEPISVNGLNIHPLNASYSDESLVITMAFLPDQEMTFSDFTLYESIAKAYTYSVNGAEASGPSYAMDVMCQYHMTIPHELMTPDENGQIRLDLELVLNEFSVKSIQDSFGYTVDPSAVSWDLVLEETEAAQDLTELGCYLETDYVDFLVLTDWEFSSETNDTYTLISLCPIYKVEGLVLSDLISTCYYLMDGRAQEFVSLCDADGTEYPIFRTAKPAPETASSEFTLWFKNLPEGEYTLNIPGICFCAEEEPTVLTLALPDADGQTLPCEQVVTLYDGSTVSISGVTRQSTRDHGTYMTEHWVDGVLNWVPEEDDITIWRYAIHYDIDTGDKLPLWGIAFSDEFCYETEGGLDPIITTSGMFHNPGTLEKLSFGIRDALNMEAPDYANLTLFESYYGDSNRYSVSITVK